ncbi:MAG: hypothetical protein V6Z81_02485 [Parvularculales bacterium]
MRDQYAGDISDFFKFSFLRALVHGTELKLGVGWYYVDCRDDPADGKHQEYLQQKDYRALDPELFDHLAKLPERSINKLQKAEIWNKSTVFHYSAVPKPLKSASRDAWAQNMVTTLSRCDMVFIDPDTGPDIGVKKPSKQHALKREIEILAANKRPLVCIKFPAHKNYDEQIFDINKHFYLFNPITLKILTIIPTETGRKVPSERWFITLNPSDDLIKRIKQFSQKLKSFDNVRSSIYGNF